MKLKDWKIHEGDVLETLQGLKDETFHGSVHDPPYGLDFMGRAWDKGVPSVEVYKELLRVLKPGAHLLAFGGSRTFHRLAVHIEDAGFEIRDCILWLYGSGMAKGKKIEIDGFEGYRTGLKPSWEPCIVAMKPLAGTFDENAARYGVAGLNGGGCMVGDEEIKTDGQSMQESQTTIGGKWSGEVDQTPRKGRLPSNLITDPLAAEMLNRRTKDKSRFFYCAKASRGERDAGLEHRESITTDDGREKAIDNPYQRGKTERKNGHPCVKPLALCEYVARLICPPDLGGPVARKIIVPYSGSGSEMIGALQAGWDYAEGIEINPAWIDIAEDRLSHHIEPPGSLFDFARRNRREADVE